MPKSDPSPVYRYTGRTHGLVPFPGVPMRDLFPDDVARLPLAVLKNATGGAKPLYVAVTTKPDAAEKSADTKKEG